MDGVKDVFDKMKDEEQTNLEAYEAAKRKFQAVSSGLFSDDGGGDNATLEDQLMRKVYFISIQKLSDSFAEV